jgi:cytoskeleton protein RodZ
VVERKAEPEAKLKAGKNTDEHEPSLGHTLIEARKSRGFSLEDAVRLARIPAHYLKMIENDDYERISDQLYLLPFLRRYAAFLKLDPEEIASRFVREVQRTDSYASKTFEPIPVAEPAAARTWLAAAVGAGIAAAVIAAVFFAFSLRRWMARPTTVQSSAHVTSQSAASPAASSIGVPPAAKPAPATGQPPQPSDRQGEPN